MMSANPKDDWRRVTQADPCPVCGRPDWCLVAADRTAAICPRIESEKRAGDAGYLHRLVERKAERVERAVQITPRGHLPDLGPLAERCARNCEPARLAGLARSLGVSPESLVALSVGWYADGSAWSWPMTDPATARVVGVRLRRPDGSKYAVTGGRDGVFLPATLNPADVMLVTEGPTDAAAALTLGYAHVVGRPSCTGGTRQIIALVRSRRPRAVAVASDDDGPGRDGSGRLAAALRLHCCDVRVVVPPAGVKDLRAWVRAGATRDDLDARIATAEPRRMTLRVTWERAGR